MEEQYNVRSYLNTSRTKQFRPGGKIHRDVKIFIDAPEEELKKIEFVQYELHPSFKNPIRISRDMADRFAIDIWTYGYFTLKANVFDKSGKRHQVEGRVEW